MAGFGHKTRAFAIAVLAATLATLPAARWRASAATAGFPQDEIEAAFLYRFAGFVSWPPGALGPSAFTIDVLGDDAVASDLERLQPRGVLNGRPVRIRSITDIGQLGDAQILYLGASDAALLRRRLAQIAGRPVLVVTSQPGGLDDGSTINFLLVNRHVRFEISLPAARRARLKLSADLLSVATHIEGRPIGSQAPCGISPLRFRPTSCVPRLASR
jgi:YfiR/HmsC-like